MIPVHYRPRIDQGNTDQKPELIRSVSRATGIVEAQLDYVVKELRDKIIKFLLSGRVVKIEGLGTWTPNIGLDGTLSLQYRADMALVNAMKYAGEFTSRFHNRQNIGKTGDELVRLWNE